MLPLALNIGIMLAGYLLVMTCLAWGLLILRRDRDRDPERGGDRGRDPDRTHPGHRGWPALILHIIGTALGGYLLLMAVVVAYYYGTAGLGGRFLVSAFAGCAALLGLSLPVFLATSWAVSRRHPQRRNLH